MRAALQGSLYLTAKILCGFSEMTDRLHKVIADYVQKELEHGRRRALIMIPRTHFKTSLFSVAYPVWRIINDPERRILLVHASSSMSEHLVRVIQGVVFGEVFRHYFPELVPDEPADDAGVRRRRNTSEFDIARHGTYPEASITARGVRSTITGGHYDDLIFDDLIDLNSSRSPAEIEAAIDFHDHADPLFVKLKEGVRMVVGTWWPGGFYEHLIASKQYKKAIFGPFVDDRFREFLKAAGADDEGYEDGQPVFPERFTLEDLARMKKNMGPYKWSHQMLNIPAEHGLTRFREADLRWYHENDDRTAAVVEGEEFPYRRMFTSMTVDIATGEGRKTDKSAITVVSHDRGDSGMKFVRYAWNGRVLMKPLMDKIVEVWQAYAPKVVGIEDVATQKIFKQFLASDMTRRGLVLPIRPLPVGGRSKFERIIEGFQPFYASREILFLREQGVEEAVNQLLSIDTVIRSGRREIAGSSPDLVDSLAMHTVFWSPAARLTSSSGVDNIDIELDDYYEEDVSVNVDYGLKCET